MTQKKEIIESLRKRFNEGQEKNRNISFPRDIDLEAINDYELLMTIRNDGVLKNMQTDASAFEGWILVLRNYGYKKFVLKWSIPDSDCTNNVHYQRFMYRVSKFNELFEFFDIDPSRESAMNKLKIDFNNKENNYILNVPTGLRTDVVEEKDKKNTNSENILEIRFVNYNYKSLINAAGLLSEKKMDRQLPVGLFKNKVEDEEKYRIFSGKSSAIDIWGIGKDEKTLNIFELKKEGNIKVGVISELFLYTMIMEDAIKGNFKFKKGSKGRLDPQKKICESGLDRICSYILAPELHPLITQDVLSPLNDELQKRNIKFGFISYELDDNLTCKKEW